MFNHVDPQLWQYLSGISRQLAEIQQTLKDIQHEQRNMERVLERLEKLHSMPFVRTSVKEES